LKAMHKALGRPEGLILKTIEEVLINIFGKKTFNKILFIMKSNYALEWKEIPKRSKDFSVALHQILGTGSIIVEDLIIESLYNNLGMELPQRKDASFSDYIDHLTKSL